MVAEPLRTGLDKTPFQHPEQNNKLNFALLIGKSLFLRICKQKF